MRTGIRKLLFGVALCAAAAPAYAAESGGAEMPHRMMVLVIQLGVILFAAKWGRILFERMKMPGVLGELCSGMLIGPFALGGFGFSGFPAGLFPAHGAFPISSELYGICSVAAIVLLFMAGLETDLHLFLRYSLAGSAVGIGGVVGSFILGDGITVLMSNWVFGQPLGFLDAPCLFLGVLSTATSVGITARVLAGRKKMDSPEGVTILAGAVIDDVLGIILLAVVIGFISARGASDAIDWEHIGIIAFKAVGIWLAATAVGLLTARRISKTLKRFRQRSAIAVMSLGLALIVAGLFEEAGLAMIIGAYIMGLSLSQTDISRLIQEKLEPVHEFLVPVFFCVMGMLVDFRSLQTAPVIVFGLIFSATAVLAKIAGCSLPALLFNFNGRGALRVGAGMVPRGEVALIMAGIGLAGGMLDRDHFGAAIMMTVLTTLFAPLMLSALFRHPGEGTRRPVKRPEKSSVEFNFPSPEIAALLTGKILDIFEEEGFFVHLLDHRHRIYQARKEDMIVSLHSLESRIIFNCRKRDIPLVNAAVYEVLGEFEAMIRGLERPIDRESIVRQVQQESDEVEKTDFRLTPYLRENCLIPLLKGETKKDVLAELLDRLLKAGLVKDRRQVYQALLTREEVMSTGMQFGIALPHAKTDAVDELVCAVGLKPEGIDFDSIDKEPTTIIVLELVPNRTNVPHIQFMSAVSKKLDEATRMRLLKCTSAAEMYAVLAE